MSQENVFVQIYKNKSWGAKGSLSGEGTRPEAVAPFLSYLSKFLRNEKGINWILDIGHGDWKMWPPNFFQGFNYHGIDIVPEVVEFCNNQYRSEYRHFQFADFLSDQLIDADLLIIKDVLIHLSDNDIHKALEIMSKYRRSIVVTDIFSKGWRVTISYPKHLLARLITGKLSLTSVFKPTGAKVRSTDIKTGGYRWVDLSDTKWCLEQKKLRLIHSQEYVVKGLTPGRTTYKRIYLFEGTQ